MERKVKPAAFWDEVKITDRKEHRRIRRLKEAAYILGNSKPVKLASIEMNTILELLIKKNRQKKKKLQYKLT